MVGSGKAFQELDLVVMEIYLSIQLACQKTVVRPNLTRPPSLVMSPILIRLIKYEMTCGDKVVIIQ